MSREANGNGQQPEPGTLKEKFGDLVELNGNGGTAETYRILAELAVDGHRYAFLQSESMRKEGDIEVFRISPDSGGDLQLETVDDEEEWERAAEAFDDLQFGSDEQP